MLKPTGYRATNQMDPRSMSITSVPQHCMYHYNLKILIGHACLKLNRIAWSNIGLFLVNSCDSSALPRLKLLS